MLGHILKKQGHYYPLNLRFSFAYLAVQSPMTARTLTVVSISFLVLLQTSRLWPKVGGGFDFVMTLVMAAIYLMLLVALLVTVYKSARERFKSRSRNVALVVTSTVLVLTFMFPFGIVDLDKFEPPDLFVAQYEGVANCTITLKLKPEQRFAVVTICFGVSESRGTYTVSGDTLRLYFDDNTKALAVLERGIASKESMGGVSYYLSQKQDRRLPMRVFKDELFGLR
jgi:hypothetical protein